MTELTRRRLFQKTGEFTGVGAVALGIIGCGDPVLPSEQRADTQKEVKRLTVLYFPNPDSVEGKIYSGEPPVGISRVYKTPVGIDVLSVGYTSAYKGNAVYSADTRFLYRPKGKQFTGYKTVESFQTAVLFSKSWLDTKTDEIKAIAMEKEAYTLAQFDGFSLMILEKYKQAGGEFQQKDPLVTDLEIARTVGWSFFVEHPEMRKLYDYAGYLPIMQRVGRLLASNDSQVLQDLRRTDLGLTYQKARDKRISFDGIQFSTDGFYTTAFAADSPWVKFISDPTIPQHSRIVQSK